MNRMNRILLIIICIGISAAAQVNAPVGNLNSCTAQGPVTVEWTTFGTPICYVSLFTSNNTITLSALAQCANGVTVGGEQYAYALQCKNLYELYINAATENDTFTDDGGCTFNTIGDITVTLQLILGEITLETTYAGEECPNATPFESAPGVFAEGPDC